jgi:hypothetical protein
MFCIAVMRSACERSLWSPDRPEWQAVRDRFAQATHPLGERLIHSLTRSANI